MSKINLQNVTLLGIDCVNVERLAQAMDVSESSIEFGAVKLLTSLPTNDHRKIEIPHIGSIEEYSRFCIEDLHRYVDTDFVLLVQYDGFILNPESWTEEFLKYDYIGSPWLVADWSVRGFNFPPATLGTLIVGNGGFCLRSKKFLETSARLSKEGKIPEKNPEDVAMCVWYRNEFEKEGIKFAPINIADLFSIEYVKKYRNNTFGFHGIYQDENIDTILNKYPNFPMYNFLHLMHKKCIKRIKSVFMHNAVEGHLVGSNARGDSDDFSDIDVWLSFQDGVFESVLEKRFDLYKEVGDVIHICEPHQNAPINGKFSSVLYKTRVGLLMVDYYLCPQSTSFITNESKTIFGDVQLPTGELELNSQKVLVDNDHRIDFFICFIFNSIKKLVRKNDQPLDGLLREYNYLQEKYHIPVKEIHNPDHTFTQLLQVSENVKEIANETQKKAIIEIENFAKLVSGNNNS